MTSFGFRPCKDDQHQWSAWYRDIQPGWRHRHCIEPGCPWKEREPIETDGMQRAVLLLALLVIGWDAVSVGLGVLFVRLGAA